MINFTGISILVVEDEELLREIVMEEFQDLGADVYGAEDGRSAFKMLEDKDFDIVLSDVRMPRGDGVELIKNIQSLTNKPKVFLCTGFSDLTFDEAQKYGVLEIFSKPFNMKTIVDRIGSSF